MKREEIFEKWKQLILDLRDKGDDLQNNMEFLSSWVQKNRELHELIKTMPPNDYKWMNDQYLEFFNKEVLPYTKDIKS